MSGAVLNLRATNCVLTAHGLWAGVLWCYTQPDGAAGRWCAHAWLGCRKGAFLGFYEDFQGVASDGCIVLDTKEDFIEV